MSNIILIYSDINIFYLPVHIAILQVNIKA